MGTDKGSKAKNATSSLAKKHKSDLISKKPASIAQNTKSQHFSPVPVVEEVRTIKGWEAWEEQLLLDGHKTGRTITEMSRDLPGRSRGACYNRWHEVLKFRGQSSDSQEKDVLKSSVRRPQYWTKEWEDWEDKVVIEHRNAGETWEEISKLVPPRTPVAVKTRWLDHLRFPLQDRVNLQPRPRTPPPMLKPEKTSNRWKKADLVLLINYRDAGKSWEEIGKLLPPHTAKSAKGRYHYYKDLQGSVRGTTNSRAQTQESFAPQPQSPSPPPIKRIKKVNNPWTEQEDQHLISLREAGKGWAEIASDFPYHSKKSCESRWREHLHPRTGASRIWTSEEEQHLRSLQESNPDDWEYIASRFTNRTWIGCKQHWVTKLRGPTANPKPRWKKTEKETLVGLYNTIGPRWQEIAKHIPGRSEKTIGVTFYHDRAGWEGVGGPSSKYWEDYFESE